MPAGVMPAVKIEIDMIVGHNGLWISGCPECKWFPEPYSSDVTAKQDAYRHNMEHHDGAGVEITTDTPLVVAEQELRATRMKELRTRRWTIAYAAYFSLISGLMFGWWFVFFTAMASALLLMYAHGWGMLTTQRMFEQHELDQMRAAFQAHEDDEGTQL